MFFPFQWNKKAVGNKEQLFNLQIVGNCFFDGNKKSLAIGKG